MSRTPRGGAEGATPSNEDDERLSSRTRRLLDEYLQERMSTRNFTPIHGRSGMATPVGENERDPTFCVAPAPPPFIDECNITLTQDRLVLIYEGLDLATTSKERAKIILHHTADMQMTCAQLSELLLALPADHHKEKVIFERYIHLVDRQSFQDEVMDQVNLSEFRRSRLMRKLVDSSATLRARLRARRSGSGFSTGGNVTPLSEDSYRGTSSGNLTPPECVMDWVLNPPLPNHPGYATPGGMGHVASSYSFSSRSSGNPERPLVKGSREHSREYAALLSSRRSSDDVDSHVAGREYYYGCLLCCCTIVAMALGVLSTLAVQNSEASIRDMWANLETTFRGRRSAMLRLDRNLCNVTALVPPEQPPHIWKIEDRFLRMCERKLRTEWKHQVERNWCWVGLKNECHYNLKAHRSWAEHQIRAAQQGNTLSREDHAFSPLENPEVCDLPRLGGSRLWMLNVKERARVWFQTHVTVYVLNLPQDAERWTDISSRLGALGISATRIAGIDMRVDGAMAAAKENGWILQEFDFERAQANAYTWKQQMGSMLGTLGCASAHFKAQSKVIADGSPLAVVLEDDTWPEDDFVERVWSLVTEELPCDWEIAALYSRCPFGRCVSDHVARVQPDHNEPAWRCHWGVNWGMQGMVYRTDVLPEIQTLWKATVFDAERPHCMDIDVALASISDQVAYYAVPAVQDPGFLRETNHRSARWDINQAGATTVTTTTTLAKIMGPDGKTVQDVEVA